MITVSQMTPVYTFVGIHKLVEEKNHHQIDLKGKKKREYTVNVLHVYLTWIILSRNQLLNKV